jgi:phage FluMu gp28-like protein
MGNARRRPATPKAIFLPYQEAWIKDPARLKLMEKSRQIGISWSTAYAAVERTAAAGARHDQWVSSRDDLQARLFLEDCKRFAQVLKVACDDLGERVIDEDRKLSAYVLHFANGRRIHSMSSNPDAQAGKRGGRVLDEFALHPDPRQLWAIAYPGITWGGSLEIVSTHRGSANFFNSLVREIRERGNPKKIGLHRVTLQDALDQGFLWKLQQSLPADHEVQALDEDGYLAYVRAGCADEESWQQEYCCNPADDAAAFLEYDLIARAEYPAGEAWELGVDGRPVGGGSPDRRNTASPIAPYVGAGLPALDSLDSAPARRAPLLYGGLDIGRTSDLTVLWVLERLGDGLYTRAVITLKAMAKPDQEAILWPWIGRLQRVSMDYTGLGIGWGDDAQRRFGAGRVELVTFTGPTKEALAYPVRGALEDRRLRIPYDPAIRADLRAVAKTVTPTGNLRFTAERSAAGHADRFWALALAIAAAAQPQAQYAYHPAVPAGALPRADPLRSRRAEELAAAHQPRTGALRRALAHRGAI